MTIKLFQQSTLTAKLAGGLLESSGRLWESFGMLWESSGRKSYPLPLRLPPLALALPLLLPLRAHILTTVLGWLGLGLLG